MYPILNTSGSALTAYQEMLDVTSNNIANANTTRTQQGGPYQRESVILEQRGANNFSNMLNSIQNGSLDSPTNVGQGVKVAQITKDPGVRLVYDPMNPDANAKGYVAYPNINIAAEMTNMMVAENAYSANVNAFNTDQQMIKEEAKIGTTV